MFSLVLLTRTFLSVVIHLFLSLLQEMDELKDEFVREKAVLSSQLRDRQEEIQALRAMVGWWSLQLHKLEKNGSPIC